MLDYVILAIDDEGAVLSILRKIIERAGFKVLTATSADEGYDILTKGMVDLILLDVNMPVTSGFELLEKIKGNEYLKDIPVIMLTCQGELTDFELGQKLGVEDYITKPFDARLLVQRINRAIVYSTRPDDFPRGTNRK